MKILHECYRLLHTYDLKQFRNAVLVIIMKIFRRDWYLYRNVPRINFFLQLYEVLVKMFHRVRFVPKICTVDEFHEFILLKGSHCTTLPIQLTATPIHELLLVLFSSSTFCWNPVERLATIKSQKSFKFAKFHKIVEKIL